MAGFPKDILQRMADLGNEAAKKLVTPSEQRVKQAEEILRDEAEFDELGAVDLGGIFLKDKSPWKAKKPGRGSTG